jgi:hypothetical protein
MFINIPAELRALKQWVMWRYEFRPPMLKPTKMPYTPRPKCGKANIHKADTWGTFEECLAAPLTVIGVDNAVDPDTPVTGFSGIGFVFTPDDPYTGIDLDDVHGDNEALQHQMEIYNKFNSYTEKSPSGSGAHIIVKGKVPTGRRRNSVELYPHHRFFTMTGDVVNPAPIREAQDALDWLYASFATDVKQYVIEADPEQKEEDNIIIERGKNATNGDKFTYLWEARWQELGYTSQSEADFALVDMLCFYTKHIPQIIRLFRQSGLGQREKAKRDQYIMYMVEKSFDRMLPPVDWQVMVRTKMGEFHKLADAVDNVTAGASTATEPGKRSSDAPATTAATATPEGGEQYLPEMSEGVNAFPPGLLGEISQFLYDAAPRPAKELAFTGAITFMAGLCGKGYNVSRSGLNQYVLLLAKTGTGKDAISGGISKLMAAMMPANPTINRFKGPGQLVSLPGLVKWLEREPCVFSIIGEFGLFMQQLVAPNANSHLIGLKKAILELYQRSGAHDTFDAMAYSEKEKNTTMLHAPSFTLFGESVPDAFYSALDETMIDSGLLPRFMLFEYKGKRSYYNENAASVLPPLSLVTRLNDLVAHCNQLTMRGMVHHVELTPEAQRISKDYDKWSTDIMNNVEGNTVHELWNRSHLKVLKLAALQAISENYLSPVVNAHHINWAINIITKQTEHVIAKFETGLIGSASTTGEVRQLNEIVAVIREFMRDPAKYAKYGGKQEMAALGVIKESSVIMRLSAKAAFKNDRMGPNYAIKRGLKMLVEADDLRVVLEKDMLEQFGTAAKAYGMINAPKFAGKDEIIIG